MNCKDCIHYDVCCELMKQLHWKPELCNSFKDKSLIVELPCKIGKELFLTDYPIYHHRLKEYKFIGERVVMVIECFELQRTCKRFVDEQFGATVFTSKSKAKLKELNDEHK